MPRSRLVALGVATAVVIALAVLVATGVGSTNGHHNRSSRYGDTPLAGKRLPAVTVKRLDADGTTVPLSSLTDGKPTVINVWSTTCVPCKTEMPAIQRVYRRLKQRIDFVGVDVEDGYQSALRFVHDRGVRYPQVRDPRAALPRALDTQAIPITVLVDGEGRIADVHLGALTSGHLEAMLRDRFGVAA